VVDSIIENENENDVDEKLPEFEVSDKVSYVNKKE